MLLRLRLWLPCRLARSSLGPEVLRQLAAALQAAQLVCPSDDLSIEEHNRHRVLALRSRQGRGRTDRRVNTSHNYQLCVPSLRSKQAMQAGVRALL